MTAFEVNDDIFQQYIKQKIINGFLQKPITVKDLIGEVKNQLRAYQSQVQSCRIESTRNAIFLM